METVKKKKRKLTQRERKFSEKKITVSYLEYFKNPKVSNNVAFI